MINQSSTPTHPPQSPPAMAMAMAVNVAHPGGRPNVSIADGLHHPAGTSGGAIAAKATASSSDVNSRTRKRGRKPGTRPDGGAANDALVSFSQWENETTQKTEQKTFICPHCGQEFERRKTGRMPTYCSSYCRVNAWKARQGVGQ